MGTELIQDRASASQRQAVAPSHGKRKPAYRPAANVGLTTSTIIAMTAGIAFIFCSAPGPQCSLPLISNLAACSTSISINLTISMLNEMFTVQGKVWPEVLGVATAQSEMPFIMKDAEIALADLHDAVMFSDLPSRVEIAAEVEQLMEMSAKLGPQVQSFISDTVYTTTSLIVFNSQSTERLEQINLSDPQIDSAKDLAVHVLKVAATAVGLTQSPQGIFKIYLELIKDIPGELKDLRHQTVIMGGTLANIDASIRRIARLALKDGAQIDLEHDKVLHSFLYWLGSRSKRIRKEKLESSGKLLTRATSYCKIAKAKVEWMKMKMGAMDNDLEKIERALGKFSYLPKIDAFNLKMHIQRVQKVTETLQSHLARSRSITEAAYDRLSKKKVKKIEY
jgi:hypothetical protein